MKKIKKNWKKILCIALICISVFAIFGGTAFLVKDVNTISATEFSRGALDENGKYLASDTSIYTKYAFGCKGLRIEPEFEADLTYDVYYYDATGKLVEAKKALTEIYDEDYPLAMTCRVVIHPAIPEDVDADEYKIGFFDVYKVANELKITVSKNQDYLYSNAVNVYDASQVQEGYSFSSTEKGAKVNLVASEGLMVSNKVAVDTENTKYDIFVKNTGADDAKAVVLVLDGEDVILLSSSVKVSNVNEGEWVKLTIDLDEIKGDAVADTIFVSMPSNSDCYIFGYAD